MNLAALTLRGRGVPATLRPAGAATRHVRGVMTRSSERVLVGERPVAETTTTLALAAADAEGMEAGDGVDVAGDKWEVVAALPSTSSTVLELKVA